MSRAMAASAAAILGLTLSACGSDDSAESSDAPAANSSTSDQGESPDSASGSDDLQQPDNLSDFPLPEEYTVVTSGSRGGAWTAALKSPTDWAELKALYQKELPGTGWTIEGERPTGAEQGIHIESSREDMEATVAISSVDDGSDILINVVKK